MSVDLAAPIVAGVLACALVLWMRVLPDLAQAESRARTQAVRAPLEQRGLVPAPRPGPAPRAHQLARRHRALARRRDR